MPVHFTTAEDEYKKNEELKKEDVKSLMEWMEKQPHLPKISEFQVILFLQSCYYSNEAAKVAIENFYTAKARWPEFFKDRHPKTVQNSMDMILLTPLPKKTPEGYKIMMTKLIDTSLEKYDYTESLKAFDMVTSLCFAQEGTANGQLLLSDAAGATIGHAMKMNIASMKKYTFFLQEALHVRLKGVHIINASPLVDKILTMMKPFLKSDIFNLIHVHTKMETLYPYIPQECLPDDFGGAAGTVAELQAKQIQNLYDNVEYFQEEEKIIANESKRVGKSKCIDELFGVGVDGTFKKLNID